MPLSAATARSTSLLISPLSKYSIGSELILISAPASAAWPTNNLAYHIPLYLPKTDMLMNFWVWNGATASSNINIGIYRQSDLTLMVSSGVIAQTGTNVIQVLAATDTIIPAGAYYMSMGLSSTAGTVFRVQNNGGPMLAAAGVGLWATGGLTAMDGNASITTVSGASSFVPMFGVSFRSVT